MVHKESSNNSYALTNKPIGCRNVEKMKSPSGEISGEKNEAQPNIPTKGAPAASVWEKSRKTSDV